MCGEICGEVCGEVCGEREIWRYAERHSPIQQVRKVIIQYVISRYTGDEKVPIEM